MNGSSNEDSSMSGKIVIGYVLNPYMLGFHAKATSTEINRNDEEVEDAQWFTLDELRNFERMGNTLPRPDSIARRLIEDWMAEFG